MNEITLNNQAERFEMTVDGQLCVLEFSLSPGLAHFNSVRVPKAVGGRGLAGQLTRHALDWARGENLKVVPNCPYVASWLERHPDYQDLLVGD